VDGDVNSGDNPDQLRRGARPGWQALEIHEAETFGRRASHTASVIVKVTIMSFSPFWMKSIARSVKLKVNTFNDVVDAAGKSSATGGRAQEETRESRRRGLGNHSRGVGACEF
jgi:hypothetical protein